MLGVLRLEDPDENYAAVRLCAELHIGEREFRRENGGWVLDLPRVRLARLEYQHGPPRPPDSAGGNQPGEAGADHHDVVQTGAPGAPAGLRRWNSRPERPGRTDHEQLAAPRAGHHSSNSA